jgi:hypothetical protein
MQRKCGTLETRRNGKRPDVTTYPPFEYRWAEGQYDGVPAMAAELVRRQVALIVANSPGVMTVKATTTTIPIVFTSRECKFEAFFTVDM